MPLLDDITHWENQAGLPHQAEAECAEGENLLTKGFLLRG
jgi:hypothetical protein